MATHSKYSRLKNAMGRGAWRVTAHGFAESDMTGATEHARSGLRTEFTGSGASSSWRGHLLCPSSHPSPSPCVRKGARRLCQAPFQMCMKQLSWPFGGSRFCRKRQKCRGLEGSVIILCDTIMMDTCLFTFVKPVECTAQTLSLNISYGL